MPKGVEHPIDSAAILLGAWVNGSEMPKGVEHSPVNVEAGIVIVVNGSEMPKGGILRVRLA